MKTPSDIEKILAPIALMVLLALPAEAAELTVRGEFQVHADWLQHGYGTKNGTPPDELNAFHSNDDALAQPHPDEFEVQQRLRVYFGFAASEQLKAVWGIEIGPSIWGNNGGGGAPGLAENTGRESGFGLDGDGVNVATRWAYLDFTVPGTAIGVRAGLQPFVFPSAFGGSAVADMDAAAIVVSAPLAEMLQATAAYSRLLYNQDIAGSNALDMVFLSLPSGPRGLSVTPWFAYAWVGKGLGEPLLDPAETSATTHSSLPAVLSPDNSLGLVAPFDQAGTPSATTGVWWAGLALSLTAIDPFELGLDFNYGAEKNSGWGIDRRGWLADAFVRYKGFSALGTPTLFGMYSTGENDASMTSGSSRAGDGKSERMPYLRENWSFPGGFWHGGSSFDAQYGHGSDFGGYSNSIGTWTVGAGLYGASFIESLRHDLIVAYISGTSADSAIPMLRAQGQGVGVGLSKSSYIWEVDFNHAYQITEQLTGIVEFGYLVPHYNEEPTWGIQGTSDPWRLLAGFKYTF